MVPNRAKRLIYSFFNSFGFFSISLRGVKYRKNFDFNSTHPDSGERERFLKLNFYFHTSLWCLKRFYEGF